MVRNINITAQNIKRSYKYHVRYNSRHGRTNFKTLRFLTDLELRSISVFELSSLCLKLSVDSSIYPFNHPCNFYVIIHSFPFLTDLELRSISVFELSSLCLKLSVDSSIYPFNHPCNFYVIIHSFPRIIQNTCFTGDS